MATPIIVAIRYSVFVPMTNLFELSRKSSGITDYKSKLFLEERLQLRRSLFAGICFPSIKEAAAQASSLAQVKVVVLTSTELPQSEKSFLSEMSAEHGMLDVLEVPPKRDAMVKTLNEYVVNYVREERYATCRIDDDDAVSRGYFVKLARNIELSSENCVVSYARGYTGVVSDCGFSRFYSCRIPNIAAGLASIHHRVGGGDDTYKHIYSYGDHRFVDKKVPVILDSRSSAYVRSMHAHQDSGSDATKHLKEEFRVDTEDVINEFPTLPLLVEQ